MTFLRALVLVSAFAVAAPQAVRGQDTGYRIRSGDRVTLDLFTAAGQRVQVVQGEHTVDLNGEVFLPYLGTVQLVGLDQSSVRRLLTEAYHPIYPDPVVDVEVELRVNITGAVGNPGQYFLDPTATLIDALAGAGGMSPEVAVSSIQIPANQREVRLVRDGQTRILNLRPGEALAEDLNMRVQSGDWLNVPFRERSRIRDEILFFGSVVSFMSSIAALVLLIR